MKIKKSCICFALVLQLGQSIFSFDQVARKPPGSLRVIPVIEILLHNWFRVMRDVVIDRKIHAFNHTIMKAGVFLRSLLQVYRRNVYG